MGRVDHPLVRGTWLISGERLAAFRRTAATAAVELEEPVALLVDERLTPRAGDVLLAQVEDAGALSGLLPGDELLVSHGDALPEGTRVTPLGLLVDARFNPVRVAGGTVLPAARTRGRRGALGSSVRPGRLPAG